jgi:hypothetical protein
MMTETDEELAPPETVFVVPIDVRIEVQVRASSAAVAEALIRAELALGRGPEIRNLRLSGQP